MLDSTFTYHHHNPEAADKEMIRKIAEFFGVVEGSIHIISGLTSRKKVIEIQRI